MAEPVAVIENEDKEPLKVLLDPMFNEIKGLLVDNSLSTIADILNEKYNFDVEVSREDVANYIYNIRSDFDVKEYRSNSNRFDIKKARDEDANKKFEPRFR